MYHILCTLFQQANPLEAAGNLRINLAVVEGVARRQSLKDRIVITGINAGKCRSERLDRL